MYGSAVRSDGYKTRLKAFLQSEYGLIAQAIREAKRGYYGETFRVDAAGQSYFLKLDSSTAHQTVYERSFPVLEHLRRHGIDFVSRVIQTSQGGLCARLDSAVAGLFAWIDGENVENEQTKAAEYRLLGRIYAVPAENLALARDSFSTASADTFFQRWQRLAAAPAPSAAGILAVLAQHRPQLLCRARRLALFAGRCRPEAAHLYITHGDPGGNVIVDGGRHFIVDWDDPLLAPPERDAWFCLHLPWAMAAFQAALAENAIRYELAPQRLAYYGYHSSFAYLNEYLDAYQDLGDPQGRLTSALSGYFQGWIQEQLRYADGLE